MSDGRRQYSDAVLDSMQLAYGEGFLSPGGAEETRTLVEGLELGGTHCLDLGSGVGGACMLLVRELGASRVTGVDVEQAAIDRAVRAAEAAGMADKIDFICIEPEAALPGADETYGAVISKDVICHVKNKPALFSEVARVLQPGATFNIADWTLGPNPAGKALFDEWLQQLSAYGLVFHYEGVDAYVAALETAGFIDIQATDHTEWSIENTRAQLERALGPNKAVTTESLGDSGYLQRTALTRARLAALEAGGAGHWLLRATRPA